MSGAAKKQANVPSYFCGDFIIFQPIVRAFLKKGFKDVFLSNEAVSRGESKRERERDPALPGRKMCKLAMCKSCSSVYNCSLLAHDTIWRLKEMC